VIALIEENGPLFSKDNGEKESEESLKAENNQEADYNRDKAELDMDTFATEKQALTDRLLRLQADFDNYRKRMRMEKDMLEEYASFTLIQKLLPVMDNLDRAASASIEAKDAVAEGLALIHRQFTEILEKEGVTRMDPVGNPFDPNFHEAVLQEKSSDCAAGTVLEEIQKGYMIKEKVLRVSMVKVSSD